MCLSTTLKYDVVCSVVFLSCCVVVFLALCFSLILSFIP